MWDLKYRPKNFSDVLGQSGAVQVLKSRLQKGTGLDTSYIFSGGHGQGKTTLARILARALLCQDLQEDGEPCNKCENCKGILEEDSLAFSEKDAASQGTIDNVRAILEDLPFALPGVEKRIYLFDEAHRMSRDAQDVLLKPIEDKRLVCILCTTEPEKIRNAIRSRCEDYALRKITREDILKRMTWVLDQEGVKYEEDAVATVIDYSGTHVRDSLNRLEMVAQLGPVTVKAVRGHLKISVVSTYYQILLSLGEPAKAIQLVEQAYDQVGSSEEVYSGLAEAAMNSYRVSNGMHIDFAFIDKELAKEVHAAYGDPGTLGLARYFLGARRPSKTSLICDVLGCSSGVPSRQVESRIVVEARAPLAAVPTEPPVSPSVSEPATSKVEVSSSREQTGPPEVQSPSEESVPPKKILRRLTSLDDMSSANGDKPRCPQNKRESQIFAKTDPDFLTPDQWRFEFKNLLRQIPSI
jgi:DNA polymerase-3 subunit gamma/tau